jgi:16S rRNA processing protein RimM
MTTPEDWVWLARIRHTQGRKGEVYADILTDFPEKFAERKRLWLLAAPLTEKSVQDGMKCQGTTLRQAQGRLSVVPQTSKNKSQASAPAGNASPREVELIAHWPHKGGIVLHFAGVDSISAAETLKGLTVAIPRSARAALAEDEVYTGDLIGCALIDVAGTEPVTVGEIESVDRTAGAVALLVVQGATGEILIPFAKSFLKKIDLKTKRVEMALPEGLVELNAPGK